MSMAPGSTILLESGTNEVEMLEFFINDERYAVNVSKVKNILPLAQLQVTDLPPGSSKFSMLVGIHGKSVPMICMHEVLTIPKIKEYERRIVIVLGFNNITVAILVDGVSKIHRINWNQFIPMNKFIINNSSQVAIGTIKPENEDIVIVDLEKIMTSYFPETNMDVELTQNEEVQDLVRSDYKIIHVDDSLTVRKIFERAMKGGGYENITSYTDGQAAYDYLKDIAAKVKKGEMKREDVVHAMVVDIEMPRMDGLTLCRRIREEFEWRDLPVILFSSLIDAQMIEKCRAVGASTQISKPGIAELAHLLDEYLAKTP